MSAAITAAVVGVGGAVYASKQAGKAGAAAAKGADAAAAEQGRQYDITNYLTANQRQIGNSALNALAAPYGFAPQQGFETGVYDAVSAGQGNVPGVGAQNFTSDEIISLLRQGKSIDEILQLGKLTSSGDRLRNELRLGEDQIAKLRGQYIAPVANSTPGSSQQLYRTDLGTKKFTSDDILPLLKQGKSIDEILQMGTLTSSGDRLRKELGYGDADIARLRGQYTPSMQTGTAPQGYSEFGFQGDRFSAAPDAPTNAMPGASAGMPDYSQFFKSPDYEFRKKEGLDAVQSSAAARGGLFSGNALRDITDYASNLAAGEYGNYFNRLGTLAGVGNAATNNLTSVGSSTAANAGNALISAGNARASGIEGSANAIGQGLNNLGGIAGYFYGNRRPYGGRNVLAGGYDVYGGVPGYGPGRLA